MEAFQLLPFDLGTQTWTAGAPLTFSFQNLPTMIGVGIGHTVFIDLELQLSPTYTTAPTLVGLNAAIAQLQVFDGERQWMPTGGSFNALRTWERAENGRIILPDPVTNGASTGLRTIRRRFAFGHGMMYGMPSDSAMPNALLQQSGYIQATCSALTAISADTTAVTGSLRATAWMAKYYDKLIFPTWYERLLVPYTSGQQFSQRAIYATAGFLNSVNFDAFAAGDIGACSIATGVDQPMTSITSSVLTAGHNADFRTGQFDGLNGDPLSATLDINGRTMNGGTPTALTNAPIDVQMLIQAPPDAKLTKLNVVVPSTMTLTSSGSNSGTQVFFTRARPLNATERGVSLAKAMQKLTGRTAKKLGLRLADDTDEYNGPLADFLPWEAKLSPMPY